MSNFFNYFHNFHLQDESLLAVGIRNAGRSPEFWRAVFLST